MDMATFKAWLNRALNLLGFAAGFTPTQVDDNIIAFLKVAVQNDEVTEFLLMLVNLLNQKKLSNPHAVLTMEDVVSVMKMKGHLPN